MQTQTTNHAWSYVDCSTGRLNRRLLPRLSRSLGKQLAVVVAVLLTSQITAPETAILSWPATSPGWVLQETGTLEIPNWTSTTKGASALRTGSGPNQVIVSSLGGSKFFRLFHP